MYVIGAGLVYSWNICFRRIKSFSQLIVVLARIYFVLQKCPKVDTNFSNSIYKGAHEILLEGYI